MKAEFNQQLSLSKLEIQDETFNFISQEIHDNVGQILSLVKMQLNVMLEKGHFPPEEIELVRSNTSRAIAELRAIAQSLNSEWLETLNLSEAIQKELDYINKAGKTHFKLCLSGTYRHLPNKLTIIIFRIVQEACQNIIKHSGASLASITVHYGVQELSIVISDDGSGFNPMPTDNQGMGLKNIRKRVDLLEGGFDLQSSPGKGTTLDLKIPFTT